MWYFDLEDVQSLSETEWTMQSAHLLDGYAFQNYKKVIEI